MSPDFLGPSEPVPPPQGPVYAPAWQPRLAAAWSLLILAAAYIALYRNAPILSEWWFAPRRPDLFHQAAFYTGLFFVLAVVLTLALVRFRDLRRMLLSRDDLTTQVTWAIAAVLTIYALETLAVVPYWLWFRPTGEAGTPVVKAFFAAAATENNVTAVILITMMGAAAEELFFRGLLLRYLRELFRSPRLAILISAVAFGLAHLGAGCFNALTAFWTGLVLGVICVRRGGLLTVTLAHFLFNASNLLLVPAIWAAD